ncbi:MAG: hypothetical protein A2X86_19315 [Bdellovibrionales bacterium GWA2_49_15]|nr:MAG: hypothetical protein A2X86_19315 [Bdellovibrionales bacterium GWA2_49_15]HAZ14379.1 hypothetical protein [Bdellovibrionales bacterium]
MKSKSYLPKFITLLLFLILLPASYAQRGGFAGKANASAAATANTVLPPGEKMGRTQLQQTCADGNPTLSANAFLYTTSYNNYLAICTEIKASLNPPSLKGGLDHAGISVTAPVKEVLIHQPPVQDNRPPAARPASNAAMDTLKTGNIGNLRNENVRNDPPAASDNVKAGRVTNRDSVNVSAVREVIRERSAVLPTTGISSTRPAARTMPTGISHSATASRASDQFQRPSSATNIFSARQDRINARQNIFRAAEDEAPVRVKASKDKTDSTGLRKEVSNQTVSNTVTGHDGVTGPVTGIDNDHIQEVSEHLEIQFQGNCHNIFDSGTTNFNDASATARGAECCRFLYKEFLDQFIVMTQNALPLDLRNQLHNQHLSNTFAAISSMGGVSSARDKLGSLTSTPITLPTSEKLFTAPASWKQAKTKPKTGIGKITNPEADSDIQLNSNYVATQKNNLKAIVNAIKSADAFLAPNEATGFKETLLNAVKNKDYAGARTAIEAIKIKAEQKLTQAQPIYDAHCATVSGSPIPRNANPSNEETKGTKKSANLRVSAHETNAAQAAEVALRNKLDALQRKCESYFHFTIFTPVSLHTDISKAKK